MLENYLVRGLLIGLIFGVPAGAIGALTIQRTLNGGFAAGLSTGLGSSAADLLYACAGIFLGTLCWWSVLSGVTAAFRRCINHRIYQILNWVLGCFMLIFGIVVLIKGLFF